MGWQQLPGDDVPVLSGPRMLARGEPQPGASGRQTACSVRPKAQALRESLSSLHPFEQLQCLKTALWIFTRSVDTNKCSIQNVTQNPQEGSPDG